MVASLREIPTGTNRSKRPSWEPPGTWLVGVDAGRWMLVPGRWLRWCRLAADPRGCRPAAASAPLGGPGVGFDVGGVGLELLGLHLLRLLHGVLDLRPHVGHPDHDEARLPLVEVLAEFLEVVAAHPGGRVTGDRAEDGAAGRG